MAPINLPDGSQVSEIVLPDGSTASEVLAPDGSTVFGNAIPDGVAVHLDASASNTISLDGNGNVQTWEDKSGNNIDFEQSDSGERPDYNVDSLNGLNTVTFDPLEYLETSNFPTSEPNTIVAVYKWEADATRGAVFGFDAGTIDDTPSFNLYQYAPKDNAFGFNTWNGDAYGIGEDVRGEKHITQTVFRDGDPSNSGVEMRINGQDESLTSVRSGHDNLTRSTEFVVGGPGHKYEDGSTPQTFDGYLAELIAWDRLLNSNEREDLDQYLNDKWAVY